MNNIHVVSPKPSLKEPNRFIDPNAPLADQVRSFEAFLKSPPENPRRVRISPALADYILKNHNIENRKRVASTIDRYADDMGNGQWILSGDTIKFGKSGNLKDGQHRLAACVVSGVPFDVFVAYGIDDRAFTVIDSGRKRTGSDTFFVGKIPDATVSAGAVRWIMILTSANPSDRSQTFANHELLKEYDRLDQPLFSNCVRDAKAMCKGLRYVHANVVAALLYLYRQKNPSATDKFVADFLHSKGAACAVAEVLADIFRFNQGRVHENIRNGLLILTLNSYLAGKRITKTKLGNWSLKDNGFPAIG